MSVAGDGVFNDEKQVMNQSAEPVAAQTSTNAPNEIPKLVELGHARGVVRTALDIFQHRELLFFLVWRDIKIKYKQTVLGVAWVVLQPLVGMALFTVLFGKVAKLPSDGLPYPVFYFTSLLVWTYFSTALVMAGNSILTNTTLITKVYFPRILLPAAAVLGAVLDLLIAAVVLFGLLWFYDIPFTPQLALLPLLLLLLLAFTLAAGQWIAAVNVNFRDIKYALPFVVQLWFFASPVVYPLSLVPKDYQWLVALNPITGVIETARALIVGRAIPWEALAISCAVTAVVFVVGLWYFQRTERRFADVI